jgi:hypothetical protein
VHGAFATLPEHVGVTRAKKKCVELLTLRFHLLSFRPAQLQRETVIEIGIKSRNTRGDVSATTSTPVVTGPVSPEFQRAIAARDLSSEYDARVLRDAGVFVCGALCAANPGR